MSIIDKLTTIITIYEGHTSTNTHHHYTTLSYSGSTITLYQNYF